MNHFMEGCFRFQWGGWMGGFIFKWGRGVASHQEGITFGGVFLKKIKRWCGGGGAGPPCPPAMENLVHGEDGFTYRELMLF